MMLKTLQHLRWIVVSLAAFVLFHVAIENSAAKKWKVVSQLPTGRSAFSTAVIDGKIYLIGGLLFESEKRNTFGLSTVEVYDTENNSWQQLADMPTPRLYAEAAVVDGKIYVVGGYRVIDRRMKTLKVVEVYDPQTDTWVRKQDMSIPRRQFGIGVVVGKIYAIGGENFFDFEKPQLLNQMEVYDPVSDIWAKRADLPSRRDEVKVAVVRDTIYVIGGSGWPPIGLGAVLATIEAYHPKTNRWREKSDMPNLRTDFSTVVVDDKIYLIGGYGVALERFDGYLKTVEVYDPETEKWDKSPPMPTGNSPFGAAAVNGKIYILGSDRENGERSLDVEVFNAGGITAIDKLPVRWSELKAEHATQP